MKVTPYNDLPLAERLVVDHAINEVRLWRACPDYIGTYEDDYVFATYSLPTFRKRLSHDDEIALRNLAIDWLTGKAAPHVCPDHPAYGVVDWDENGTSLTILRICAESPPEHGAKYH